MNNIISFYEILEQSLKGKLINIRVYWTSRPDWCCYEHDLVETDKVIGWSDREPFTEFTGVVDRVLHSDSSHVDIVFKEGTATNGNCFNLHMGDYIRILD